MNEFTKLHEDITKIAEALSKQEPKVPKPCVSKTLRICPNCDRFIQKNEPTHGNINIPYCKWCGQALDWSEQQ